MLQSHKMLLRYKTLDKCFRMRSKKWTLDMLVIHCSEILGESVSKRSVQSDIHFLRDLNDGYAAPIIVMQKKYYTYEDKKFSIFGCKIPPKIQNNIDESADYLKEIGLFTSIKSKTVSLDFDILNFEKKGYAIQNSLYSLQEVRSIEALIKRNGILNAENILQKAPQSFDYLKNVKLRKLLKKIDPRAVLVDAVFFESQFPYDFQQTLKLPLKKRNIPHNLTLWGYPAEENFEKPDKVQLYEKTFAVQIFFKNIEANTGALNVIPGSHQRELSPLEVRLITDNVSANACEVKKGDVLIYKPLIISSIEESSSPKKKQSVVLWFSSYQLPVQYTWNLE